MAKEKNRKEKIDDFVSKVKPEQTFSSNPDLSSGFYVISIQVVCAATAAAAAAYWHISVEIELLKRSLNAKISRSG